MVPIEDNHEILDIILGYKPDKILMDYVELRVTTSMSVEPNFYISGPSGEQLTGLGVYKLKTLGTWSYGALAEGYTPMYGTIVVTEARYGEYINLDINLQEIVSDKVEINQLNVALYQDTSDNWRVDSSELLSPFIVDRYIATESSGYSYSTKLSDYAMYDGYVNYKVDTNSYFKNEYMSDTYLPVTYYYNTVGMEAGWVHPTLDTIPFIKNEYLSSDEHYLKLNFFNAVTGEPLEFDYSGNPPQISGESGWSTQDKYGGFSGTELFNTYHEDNHITIVGRHYNIGYYTFKITAVGFVDYYYNGVLFTDQDYGPEMERWQNVDIYLMPEEKAEGFAAILTWGESPSDLDSHLLIYNGDNGYLKAKVNYQNTTYYIDEEIAAQLDVDDTSSYGPETTTVSIVENNTEYYFYVHCFAEATYGIPLGAKVEVYMDGRRIRSEQVYPFYHNVGNSSYRYWKVFSYNTRTRELIFNGDNETEVPSIVSYEPDRDSWFNS